ncbi:MAG TPA: metallophosphoesterase [Nocardioides sp.]|nr:metallophosphoesterase [Nocardioides sp.]
MRTLVTAILSILLLVSGCAGDRVAPGVEASPQVAGTATATDGSFTFAAAGDLGARTATARSLALLDGSPAALFVALGDLSYDDVVPESAWCDYVRAGLPSRDDTFPFALLAGNHEADGGPDGRLRSFAECLPDRLASSGTYGAQYAFTYPADRPLARFVLVSPGLTVDGHRYDYSAGTPDRAWLAGQMRRAREAGQWLVVGMHLPCLSTGADHPGCESGRAVHNLVLRGGADLLLVGHNHVYERSKQIALSRTCPKVRARFDADCVVDSGRDGAYRRDRGTVQVTAGRFGARYSRLSDGDPDRRWFVRRGDRTTGFLEVQVTPQRLVARYRPSSGTLTDRFVIG